MAARTKRLIVVAVLVVAAGNLRASGKQISTNQRTTATRVVSLVPALTEMLFAVGAGPQVVGVSSYDAFPPDVKRLPRVGALLDPDTERILSLRPDLVLLYGSQVEQQALFERAGIRTYGYRHAGISGALHSIDEIGRLTGHPAEAQRLIRTVEAKLDAVRARVAGRQRPRTLLVFERQPGTLQGLYASGGRGFLNEMLDIAGGVNVFADMPRESVQPSHETLLMRAPEVIIEISARGLAGSDTDQERRIWSRLASVPAVRQGRILFLSGEHLVVPGPRLAEGTEALAGALHPEAFK